MGFTDLVLRCTSQKAISPSHYDKEFVVATIKKINQAINPTDNGKMNCNAIGLILEISNYARLRNYVITSVHKLINSTLPICNLKLSRTELCNSKCIPSDFLNIDSTKISYQILLFYIF